MSCSHLPGDRADGSHEACLRVTVAASQIVESDMASTRAAVLGALVVLYGVGSAPLSAQNPADLAGSWTLNRQLSQFPSEVGFSTTFLDTAGAVPAAGGGGRRGGSRGGGGLSSSRIQSETPEDAQRVLFLTDEVRTPYDHLAIAVTPADVTITPDRAPARTFHPGRRDEQVTLGKVTAGATASWEVGRLVILYAAETGRTLRYTYSLNQNPTQLVVDVEFIERGGGDKVRRIYEPTRAVDTLTAPSTSARGATNSPIASAAAPSSAAPGPAALDQRPDAPLRGLTRLGVVVEKFTPDAAKCGLKEDALETAVAKRLTDAGFRVVRDSDDDTYLYVNINTVTASDGMCVSRYDVTLYSHTVSKLSYTASPVLLQVELLHKGGIAGGDPATHGGGVMKSVLESVDEFSTRMRNANN